jgi:hypothetical protein
MAHTDKLIHSINVGGVLYEIHDAQAIHKIEDLNLSSVLKFGGVVETRNNLPAAAADTEGYVYHIKAEDAEVVCVNVDDAYHWEDFGHAIVTDHVHQVTVTPASTAEASKVVTTGQVVAGTLPSFTPGAFSAGSYTQGEDEFTAGSFKAGSVELNYTAPTYQQGTDTFQANVPTKIDTTKFNAGAATLNEGTYTAPSVTFAQGTDQFTANRPTAIDVTKFNAGNMTQTDINYVAPTLTDCQLVQSVDNGVLSFTLTPGVLTGGSVTGGKVSYTAPSLGDGFYTAGSAATFAQGQDTHTFNAGSYTAPTLTYTAPSFQAGFCTEGSAATFAQGVDTFNKGGATISETPAEWVAPTFKQGQDTYVAPSKAADVFDAGAHVQVTLPTFTAVTGLWNGANATGTSGKPEEA